LVLGDARLIYLIRHPIERMRSHCLYTSARARNCLYNLSPGQEWRPIEGAFANEPTYVKISRYAPQLDQYAPHAREIVMHIPQPVKDLKHRLTGRLATEELDTRRGTISEDLGAHLRESLCARMWLFSVTTSAATSMDGGIA
jgi:hypothetical protein